MVNHAQRRLDPLRPAPPDADRRGEHVPYKRHHFWLVTNKALHTAIPISPTHIRAALCHLELHGRVLRQGNGTHTTDWRVAQDAPAVPVPLDEKVA